MRGRFVAVLGLLVASFGAFAGAAPAAAAGTCFGRAATVAPVNGVYALTRGDDVVVGTSGPDLVTAYDNAGGGNDLVCTGGGDDHVDIQKLPPPASLTVDLGSGDDRLTVVNNPDILNGGAVDAWLGSGNDRFTGDALHGTVRGGSGNDVFTNGGGGLVPGSTVDAGSGDDDISSRTFETILGGSGADRVVDSSDGGARMDCGSGVDRFFAPQATQVRRCERRIL